jgi:hypothetical protein
MANADQPILLDAMIARLEKANARAYEEFSVKSEGISKSNKDHERHPTDHLSASTIEQSSRAGQSFIALIALLLAACAFAIVLAWEPSYGEAAKRFARWANPWVFQSSPHAQTALWEGSPAVPLISPDITQRLQTIADRLANVEQKLEPLEASQQTSRSDAAVSEKFRASPQQMARNNAEVVEQLYAALAQLDRQNAAVARQVKANQEQLATLASLRGRYGWKHPRQSPSR